MESRLTDTGVVNLEEDIFEKPIEGLLQPKYENQGQKRFKKVNRCSAKKHNLRYFLTSKKTTEDYTTYQYLLILLPKRNHKWLN